MTPQRVDNLPSDEYMAEFWQRPADPPLTGMTKETVDIAALSAKVDELTALHKAELAKARLAAIGLVMPEPTAEQMLDYILGPTNWVRQ